MLTPERFQEYVLPYLYDLLDDGERREFEEYLAAAPEAQPIVEATRAKLGLIAEAARDEFPEVAFTPPAPSEKPIVVQPFSGRRAPAAPPRRPEREKVRWGRWALAAALLIAVLGGGGYWSIGGWAHRKDELALARIKAEQAQGEFQRIQFTMKEQAARAQQDIRDIQEQINRLIGDWNQEIQNERRVHQNKQVQVIIQGPRNLQAGC